MNRRSLLLGLSGATALASFGGWILSEKTGIQTGFVTPAAAADAAPILPDVVIGSADAPVTLIEYASFTCPHCAHWHRDVWPLLKKDYVDTGKVKFILREVYFDKFGLWAGLIAQCGGDPKYYAVAGMIFDQQKDWIGDAKETTIADNLRKLGRTAGLSDDQIATCLKDQDRARSMVATFQKHASDDQIDATPTFMINGQKYSNMSYDDMKKIIEEKLAG